jgi:hypothetical protein
MFDLTIHGIPIYQHATRNPIPGMQHDFLLVGYDDPLAQTYSTPALFFPVSWGLNFVGLSFHSSRGFLSRNPKSCYWTLDGEEMGSAPGPRQRFFVIIRSLREISSAVASFATSPLQESSRSMDAEENEASAKLALEQAALTEQDVATVYHLDGKRAGSVARFINHNHTARRSFCTI